MPEPIITGGLAWSSVFLSLLPTITGGVVSQFGVFVPTRDSFRRRVRLMRVTLEERLSISHAALLSHLRSSDDLLRGDGRNEPDLVADFTAAASKYVEWRLRLTAIESWLSLGHTILLVTSIAGLALALLVGLDMILPRTAGYSALGTLALQVLTIGAVCALDKKADLFEDLQ